MTTPLSPEQFAERLSRILFGLGERLHDLPRGKTFNVGCEVESIRALIAEGMHGCARNWDLGQEVCEVCALVELRKVFGITERTSDAKD